MKLFQFEPYTFGEFLVDKVLISKKYIFLFLIRNDGDDTVDMYVGSYSKEMYNFYCNNLQELMSKMYFT